MPTMPPRAGTGRRRAPVRRSRAPLLLALVAVSGIAVTVAATGLVGRPDPTGDGSADRSGESGAATGADPDRSAAAVPSPLDVDLGSLPVPRSLADCSVLDGDAVHDALGAPVSLRQAYRSGDRVEVAPGVTDVVAEDGCVFRSPRADARVWVFSAPVGTAFARTLVRQASRSPGCTEAPDGAGFGDPGLTDVCTTRTRGDEPATTSATLRGLFDDAWLTCRLSVEDGSPDEVLARARSWCVEAAVTLAASD